MAYRLRHVWNYGNFRIRGKDVLGKQVKAKAETVVIYFLTGMFVVSLSVLAFSWFRAFMIPGIIYGDYNEIIPPVTQSPSVIQLCRDFRFNRHMDIQIARYLIRQDGKTIRSIDIGSTVVHRLPGEVEQCRLLNIPPGVEPGNWTFKTYVTWTDWPFWTQTQESPDIPLKIE